MGNIKVQKNLLGFFLISIAYFCIHGALFLHDLSVPDAFLNGDRAASRIDKLIAFGATNPDYTKLLFDSFLGDFIIHALLFKIGGQYLVIIAQVFLQFAGLAVIYFAAEKLAGNTVATAASVLYILMPGALMNPHILVTETWSTTFLTIGTVCCCLAVEEKQHVRPYVLVGFVALALSAFVRPQGLLAPLAMALAMMFLMKEHRRSVLVALALSYLIFPCSVMLLRALFVGRFDLGAWDGDLGTNLLIRSNRILSLPTLDVPQHKPTVLEFLKLAVAHPVATIGTYYADLVNFLLNPGSNHVFGYYLKLFEPNADVTHWHDLLDRSGVFGAAREILSQNSLFILTFVIWACIHGVVLLGVGFASFRVLSAKGPPWAQLLLIVIAVSVASTFAAGLVRWSHRSGIEPLLALFAAWGFFGVPTASSIVASLQHFMRATRILREPFECRNLK